MGERTSYTPGTFSWADLSTTDQAGATDFYTALFGWEVVENPVDDDTVYSMMFIDGKPVAAISPQPRQQREAGVPPVWNSYVTVESADAALDRARELGGAVHAPAFDVLEAGRMGVVQDPQGAFFLVWEPREHIGAGLVNAPGALSWNELATTDMEAAQPFYSELFGWSFEAMDLGEMPYAVMKNRDGHTNGGITGVQPAGTPPHWLVYFGCEDIKRDMARVGELGGAHLAGPIEIGPNGSIGVVRDPQGAVFALYAGQFED